VGVCCEDPVIVGVRVPTEERDSEGAPELVGNPEAVCITEAVPTLD